MSPRIVVYADPAHGAGEDRFLAILPRHGNHEGLLIGFTWRDRTGRRLIRPVTARYMHLKELRRYGLDKD